MNFNPSLAGFLLAFLGTVSGWVIWWISRRGQSIQEAVDSAEKALNAKRDFDHLIRNQDEISKNIAFGFDDIENRLAEQNSELREIKTYIIQNRPNYKES